MSDGANFWAAFGACATAVISLGLLLISYFEWRIQSLRFRGKLLFELVPKGEYISVALSNTGECVIREIKISSNPSLAINFNNKFHYDGCVGTYDSWLIGRVIHELLPHQSITDENPFPAKDFYIHFANYSTIVIQLQYTINGKIIRDCQTVDIGILMTKQTVGDTRKMIYQGLEEKDRS